MNSLRISGRGYERDPRGRRKWVGSGRGTAPPASDALKSEIKFKGRNDDLPYLNYGAAPKENRPIEFLQLVGEYCAVNYKAQIAQAFWTSPPVYGEDEIKPIMPDPIPNTNVGKAMLADYTNDRKEWKIEMKKVEEHKRAVFALVYNQLSDSSRSEVKGHEDSDANFNIRNLIILITRIRTTHIARQIGNPEQDKERVRNGWAGMRMQPNESSFGFRKRVEDYQLERSSVGLPISGCTVGFPDGELIIGILNRLDMSRYASLAKDYLDNERRGIATLPVLPSTLWKEIKDTQIIRFRGTTGVNLQSVYYSSADGVENVSSGRFIRGRGGRGYRGGRGQGRGRGSGRQSTLSGPPATLDSIKPIDILCWTCGKKGHKSTTCPTKSTNSIYLTKPVSYFDVTIDEPIYLTTYRRLLPI